MIGFAKLITFCNTAGCHLKGLFFPKMCFNTGKWFQYDEYGLLSLRKFPIIHRKYALLHRAIYMTFGEQALLYLLLTCEMHICLIRCNRYLHKIFHNRFLIRGLIGLQQSNLTSFDFSTIISFTIGMSPIRLRKRTRISPFTQPGREWMSLRHEPPISHPVLTVAFTEGHQNYQTIFHSFDTFWNAK